MDAPVRAILAACTGLSTSKLFSTPSEHTKRFFDETIINYIAAQSNLYAVQQNPSKPLKLRKNKLAKFIAVILKNVSYAITSVSVILVGGVWN